MSEGRRVKVRGGVGGGCGANRKHDTTTVPKSQPPVRTPTADSNKNNDDDDDDDRPTTAGGQPTTENNNDEKEKKRQKMMKKMRKLLVKVWSLTGAEPFHNTNDNNNNNNSNCGWSLSHVGRKLDDNDNDYNKASFKQAWQAFATDLGSVYTTHIHQR